MSDKHLFNKRFRPTLLEDRVGIVAEFLEGSIDLAQMVELYLGQYMFYSQINPNHSLLQPLVKGLDTSFTIPIYNEELEMVYNIKGVIPKSVYSLLDRFKKDQKEPFYFNASLHSNIVVVAIATVWYVWFVHLCMCPVLQFDGQDSIFYIEIALFWNACFIISPY